MEKIQVGYRRLKRFSVFLFTVLLLFIKGFWVLLTVKDEIERKRRLSRNVQEVCAFIVRNFDMRVDVVNKPEGHENFLLVGNHMGFVDILVNGAQFPQLFVTSKEMKETPVLGTITEMGGCLYVERRSRQQILEEQKNIAAVIKKGLNVVLYPEATSTNGEQVLPFKKTLMMAAAHAQVAIQPVVMNFVSINEETYLYKYRDYVCWYGDIPFLVSLWRIFSLRSIHVELKYLEPYYPKIDEDRGVVADIVYQRVVQHFRPFRP